MTTEHENRRHELIHEMERLYKQRPYNDQELAKLLDTDRTNIFRIRRMMNEKMGIPIEPDAKQRGHYYIPKAYTISHIPLNRSEAAQLYLAGRRLQQQTRTSQRPVVSAIEKLAQALGKPLAEKMVRAAEVVLTQEQDPQQEAIFATLVECWLDGIPVRITHRRHHGEARTYRVHPYQLEPSVWGDGSYLIGHSEWHGKLATFKLARIEKAVKGTGSFTIPADFDIHDLLNQAWGIWHADEAPQTVKLHFSHQVTPRVRETIWHPQQTLLLLDDGRSEWTAPIAEPREMLPWVRGWGAAVEVIEPDWLREQLAGEVQRMAILYGVNSTQEQSLDKKLLQCWGKTGKGDVVFHPALFHMIDIAHVAQQFLSSSASRRWRQVLSYALNTEEATLFEWVPWLVSLHDMGKLSVPFQAQNQAQKIRMEVEGFDFGNISPKQSRELHHTITGRLILTEVAQQFPFSLQQAFQEMISGHHGVYQRPDSRHRRDFALLKESADWTGMRHRALDILANLFLLRKPTAWPEPTNVSVAIAALNGFTILCDWLGSDESVFRATPHAELLDYVGMSRERANHAVKRAGFFAQTSSSAPTNFADLFTDRPNPRPLQFAVDEVPDEILSQPCLAIVEAPTGEGKTEAALTLARRIAALRGTDEFYVALPTTATSNAMFSRIQSYLRSQLGLSSDLVKLVHGQDFLVEDDLRLDPMDNGSEEEHLSLDWFSPKKRALLSPFGVGTVDQAELSALNVRHNALRMIGLAGKVVILDEVHAYDTYMTTIIEQMLSWLAALGTSVILLSATLPSARRRGLAEAFTGTTELSSPVESSYPSLLVISQQGQVYQRSPAAYQDGRIVETRHLHYASDDWVEAARWLADTVKDGGCACWIVNTVQRAQQIYRRLQEVVPQDVDCELLHARFPLEDRQGVEKRILDKYGEKGNRPPKGIVVGTQVLEQSLDLDFDVMVSDLAPVDLLLQRAGRLHRHPWREGRPSAHAKPVLYIQCEMAEGGLVVGADRFYTEYLLHKTWEVLHNRQELNLPLDYRELVELVYDESELSPDSPLFPLWEKRSKQQIHHEDEARLRLSGPPDPMVPFCQANRNPFREDEDSNAWVVAQTRLGQETITVIPLTRLDGDTATLTPTGEQIALNRAASRDDQLRLLRRSLRLSNPTVVGALRQLEKERPRLFSESPLLKRCYPLFLDENGVELTHERRRVQVSMDEQLGIVIEKGE